MHTKRSRLRTRRPKIGHQKVKIGHQKLRFHTRAREGTEFNCSLEQEGAYSLFMEGMSAFWGGAP